MAFNIQTAEGIGSQLGRLLDMVRGGSETLQRVTECCVLASVDRRGEGLKGGTDRLQICPRGTITGCQSDVHDHERERDGHPIQFDSHREWAITDVRVAGATEENRSALGS
jgi:hypothetical protein